MDAQVAPAPRLLGGRSSRLAAMQMNPGNLISMPLPALRFGGPMPIYALHRHHPNPRVGRCIRRAAYRFCAALAVIIPRSLWSIVRIRGVAWPDIELPAESPPAEEPAS